MGSARVRGGASHPCPQCGAVTRVLRTTKIDMTVQRHRQCLRCHHEYHTTEEQQ
jgi:transcriptional regulator NrdR family protein